MRIAILANPANSFVLPLAQGLQRMFEELRVDATVFRYGTNALAFSARPSPPLGTRLKDVVRNACAPLYLRRLRGFDVIVVVGPIPSIFLRSFRTEFIRRMCPGVPVVAYSNYYLPTCHPFGHWLKAGNAEHGIVGGGHFGLERYDWYLCSSVVTEHPMPLGPQPCTLIGTRLDQSTLFPEQNGEFVALVDFERPDFAEERAVQLQALRETGTNYIELKGRYSVADIRKIYRKSSIYFIAHRESFGLPICELQACGSYVFTPYAIWCAAHFRKENLHVSGPGTLSPNFVVYNDKDGLCDQIRAIRGSYNAAQVVDTFNKCHPQLLNGDIEKLREFVEMVRIGEINSDLHLKNAENAVHSVRENAA